MSVKLQNDLKTAHVEGIRANGLDHRLQCSLQDNEELRVQQEAAEKALKEKERELLEFIQQTQVKEEQKNIAFEAEVLRLSSSLKAVTEKYQTSLGRYESLKEQILLLEESQEGQVDALQTKLLSLRDAQFATQEQMENLVKTKEALECCLSEKETQIIALKADLDEEHFKRSLLSEEKKKLNDALQESFSFKLQAEEGFQIELHRLKEDLLLAERTAEDASHLVTIGAQKLADAVDESRALRSELEAQRKSAVEEMDSMKIELHSLQKEVQIVATRLIEAERDVEHHKRYADNIQRLALSSSFSISCSRSYSPCPFLLDALIFYRQFTVDFADLYKEKTEALNTIATLTQQLHLSTSESNDFKVELENIRLREKEMEKAFLSLEEEKNLLHKQLTESIDMYTSESRMASQRLIEAESAEDKLQSAERRLEKLMENVFMLTKKKKEKEEEDLLFQSDIRDFNSVVVSSIDSLSSISFSTNLLLAPAAKVSSYSSDGPLADSYYQYYQLKSSVSHLIDLSTSLLSLLQQKTFEIEEKQRNLKQLESQFELQSKEQVDLLEELSHLKVEIDGVSSLLDQSQVKLQQYHAKMTSMDSLLVAFRENCVEKCEKEMRSMITKHCPSYPFSSPKPIEGSLFPISRSSDEKSVLDSFANTLKQVLTEVSSQLEATNEHVEEALQHLTLSNKESLLFSEGLQARLSEQEVVSLQEQQLLQEQVASLEHRLAEKNLHSKQLLTEVELQKEEITKLKAYLTESAESTSDLEREVRSASQNNAGTSSSSSPSTSSSSSSSTSFSSIFFSSSTS